MRPPLPHTSLAATRSLGLAAIAALAFAACDGNGADPPAEAQLSIAPIAQQTEVWCWAATIEMVLRHFGAPNLNEGGDYQCGIVAVYALINYGAGHPCTADCGRCLDPINGMPEVERLVEEYGRVARGAGLQSPVLSARSAARRLSYDELREELGAGSPVIAAVSTSGEPFPEANDHVVVISGYDASGVLTVNDPYPYERFVPESRNPYVLAGGRAVRGGQYEIGFDAFVEWFGWAGTLYRIRD